MKEEYARTQLLLGEKGINCLKNKKVIIFGVGGVGSYVAESLARTGVGMIDLVDDDDVSLSNINRQIIALHSTVGLKKVDVMADRIADINPDIKVCRYPIFYLPETKDQFDFSSYDYMIDCCDTVKAKLSIIEEAYSVNKPVISAMGAGNKLHPELFEITDIYKTCYDPLSKVIRAECRKRGIKKLKVCFSREQPIKISSAHQRIPGSISFVPSSAGLLIASAVINDLLSA